MYITTFGIKKITKFILLVQSAAVSNVLVD